MSLSGKGGGAHFAPGLPGAHSRRARSGIYSVGVWTFGPRGEETSCEVVALAEVGSKLLVVVPTSVWHKKAARRILPRNSLSKVVGLDVAAAAEGDRSSPETSSLLKVWAGFLDPHEGNLALDGDASADHVFGVDGDGRVLLPHGAALAAAAQESLGYQTAESGGGSEAQALDSRVAALESSMSKVAAGVKALVAMQEKAGAGGGTGPGQQLKPKAASKPAARPEQGLASFTWTRLWRGLRWMRGRDGQAGCYRAARRLRRRVWVSCCRAARRLAAALGVGGRAGSGGVSCAGESLDYGSSGPGLAEACSGGGDPCAGQSQEEAVVPAGPAPRWFRGRRVWISRRRSLLEAERRREAGSTLRIGGQSASDFQDHHGFDGRRSSRSCAARRSVSFDCQGLGRASIPHRPLSDDCQISMGDRRMLGLTPHGEACRNGSPLGHPALATGSGGSRPRVVDVGVRAEPRTTCAPPFFQTSRIEGARADILAASRRSLGRNRTPSSPRPGGFYGKERAAQQAPPDAKCHHRCGGGAGERTAQAQGQGKGEGRREERQGRRSLKATCAAEPDVTVPGATAPTLSVPGFWHSLPSWIFKCKGPFSTFLRAMIAAVNMTANTSLVWPCPLPYPEVLCPGPCGSDAWLRKRINLVVASLSWLALGSPARPPTGFGKGRPLSPKQWEAVRSLERLACDRSLTFKLDPALMGRAASKAEDHNKVLAALGRAVSSFESSAGYFAPSGRAGSARTPWPRDFSAEDALPSDSSSAGFASPAPFGQQLGNLRVPPFCPAKPIQADRLRFPPPPSFDPRPYLDKPTAARFERPLDFACVASSDVSLPRVGILASVDERLKLLRTLAQTGRLQPIMPLPQREPVGAGLFAVVKDLTRDRLILDARPANALESPPCFWTGSLASAAALLPILLGPEEEIRISSADLKDFFYLFKVSEQRLQRNLLSGSLGPSEATFVFGSRQRAFEDSKGFLRVALSTLAMGDSSACEFAQGSHLGVLFRHGVLRPDELLCPTSAPPRGLLTIGVVIDDFVILEKVTRSELRLGGRQSLGLERAHAAYAEAGLLANPEKGAKDESVSSFWGVTLDGRRGLVRASLARVGPLTCITCRVALLGLCTRPLLESLVARPAPPHRPHRPHRPTKTAEAQKLCAVQPAS